MTINTMNKYFYMPLFLLILSCNQQPSQVEKDYIKNLEEKNRVLEAELQQLKGKPEAIDKVETKNKSDHSKDYFTIGSTEDELIEVMGEPTSYLKTAPEAREFHYELSTVYFYQGKMINYDNLKDNLKVKK